MSPYSAVRLEMHGALAIVALVQRERGNPFDGDFTADFKQVVADLSDTRGLRGVLLRSEGPNFSVGGDLKKFHPERADLAPLVRRWTADLHIGLQRFWRLPVPVVAAVQGFAMGGGVALLAGCDLVLAAESARFGSAFVSLGFSCDSGSSATLTARMGAARARRFVMMAEMLGSREALQCGLVDRIVADDELQGQALELAERWAEGPTLALGEIKRLFLRAGTLQLESQLEDEAMTLARVSATADAQEGIAAMVERRKPVFRGA